MSSSNSSTAMNPPSRPVTPLEKILPPTASGSFSSTTNTDSESSFVATSSTPSSFASSESSPLIFGNRDLPKNLPRRPVTPDSPTPIASIRRSITPARIISSASSKAHVSARATSCLTRFTLLLWLTTISGFVVWYGWHTSRGPPPLPLESIAHITAQHVTLGLEVVQDLQEVRESCGWRDLHAKELSELSSATRPFSARAADGLLVSSDTVNKLSQSISTPNAFVSAHLSALSIHLAGLVKLLKSSSSTSQRNMQSESYIRGHINDYLSDTLPSDLRELQHLIDVARERCEVIAYQKLSVIPELQRLQRQMGLVRPPAWVWWKRKAWEADVHVQARVRALGWTVETFNAVERLKDALEKSKDSVGRYVKADVFERLEDYPARDVLTDKNVTIEQYLEYIAGPLEQLQSLVRIAHAKIHA